MIVDSQSEGIAYICSLEDDSSIILGEEYGEWEWVERDQFPEYIENKYVLNDLEGLEL